MNIFPFSFYDFRDDVMIDVRIFMLLLIRDNLFRFKHNFCGDIPHSHVWTRMNLQIQHTGMKLQNRAINRL